MQFPETHTETRVSTMKAIVICTSLLLLVSPAFAEEKTTDHAQSLKKSLQAFHEKMKDDSRDVRKKALEGILPTKADVKTLFPKHADAIWGFLDRHNKQMIAHVDEVTAELNRHEWIDFETIDVRKLDVSGRYGNVLKVLPKKIPIFRVIKKAKSSSAGSSSYLFLNGRWIHFQSIESVPDLVKQLEKKGNK